ncbi:MAG: Fis family transcriptional regulator [Sphingobacteriia bacterium]|nr:Fis family transcriptional regulator [Sphingobacteriia bacterium]NCC38022.1 Fis family transcriptional regulator [Gammaproteobacteria bacterium]
MKTTSPDPVTEPIASGPGLAKTDGNDPLSKSVRDALCFYLDNMGGHEVTDLYALVMEEVERPLFETVMAHTNGNLSQAAKMLGMTRATLRKRLVLRGIARAKG